MTRFAVFLGLTILILTGCASTPAPLSVVEPPANLGVPLPPSPLSVTLSTETLGTRWTLVRALGKEVRRTGSNEEYDAEVNLADAPLGLSLSQGLFLDVHGNLSILPWELTTGVPTAVSFPDESVWGNSKWLAATVASTEGLPRVEVASVLGPRVRSVRKEGASTIALGYEVAPGSTGDGRLVQTFWTPLRLGMSAIGVVPTSDGVAVEVGGFVIQRTTFTTDGTVTKASDGSYKLTRRADHILIETADQGSFRYYRSETGGAVVRVRTGEVFAWKVVPGGLDIVGGGQFRYTSSP